VWGSLLRGSTYKASLQTLPGCAEGGATLTRNSIAAAAMIIFVRVIVLMSRGEAASVESGGLKVRGPVWQGEGQFASKKPSSFGPSQ